MDRKLENRNWKIAKTYPRRCTEKSAEVIDGKGVASARGVQRVRNRMKTKEMNEAEDFADGREGGNGNQACGVPVIEDGGEKPFRMVAWNYDSVNTRISD